MKTRRRARRDPVRRLPGPPRADAAVGERPARQGVPIGHGHAGRSAASSASASRSRTAGRTRCRASRRSGCGWPRARPTACGRGSRSSPACSTTGAGCRSVERIYDWHYRHERYLRNETPLARVALLHSEQTDAYHPGVGPGRSATRITCSACTTRWSSRACRSSWSTKRSSRPRRLDPFKLLILRGRGGAVRRAVRRDSRLRQPRRQRARHVRVVAVRRDRQSARRLRPRRCVRRVVRRPHRRADAELVSRASMPIRRPAGGTPILDGLDDAPRIVNGVFRIDVQADADVPVAGDADSVVSGSADGGRLSARAAHRDARAVLCATLAAAASSTSRGTSIARSGTSCASITCGCCRTPSRGRSTSRRRSRSTARACST